MPLLGIVRDEKHLRFGFILQPPQYIESYEQLEREKTAGGVSKQRLPQTLLDRIEKGNILPLGDRFNLARKLARTLYVMHTAGWVHKKWVTPHDGRKRLVRIIKASAHLRSFSCQPNQLMEGFHRRVVRKV